MRKYLGLAIGIAIVVSSVAIVPTAQARRWATCDNASWCAKLSASCDEAGGVYGQVNYPDGSVWGYCSAD